MIAVLSEHKAVLGLDTTLGKSLMNEINKREPSLQSLLYINIVWFIHYQK